MHSFFKKVHIFENFTYQVYTYIENLYNEIKNDAIFPDLVCAILVSFFYWAQIPVKILDVWKYTKQGQEKQAFSFLKWTQLVGRIVKKKKKSKTVRHWSLNHKKCMHVQRAHLVKMCKNQKANLLLKNSFSYIAITLAPTVGAKKFCKYCFFL